MKTCTKCSLELPTSEFYPDGRRPGKLIAQCVACHTSASRERYQKNHARERTRQRTYYLQSRYLMTREEYAARVAAQSGVCAICSESCPVFGKLSVDHDHETGKVRDLLCNSCNTALGHFRDRPELLLRAAAYLERHASVHLDA
jgi:hypothetical protein